MQTEAQTLVHPLKPVWSRDSQILILGSFPSVLSRKSAFYYGNPQNRFWKVLFHAPLPENNEGKRALLIANGIALWDVIASCRICGSADSSIADVVPNDLSGLLSQAPIRRILLNGKTAERLFYRYNSGLSIPVIALPSTSPANAAWNLERLCKAWGAALHESISCGFFHFF